jgi:hypothetical protein
MNASPCAPSFRRSRPACESSQAIRALLRRCAGDAGAARQSSSSVATSASLPANRCPQRLAPASHSNPGPRAPRYQHRRISTVSHRYSATRSAPAGSGNQSSPAPARLDPAAGRTTARPGQPAAADRPAGALPASCRMECNIDDPTGAGRTRGRSVRIPLSASARDAASQIAATATATRSTSSNYSSAPHPRRPQGIAGGESQRVFDAERELSRPAKTAYRPLVSD